MLERVQIYTFINKIQFYGEDLMFRVKCKKLFEFGFEFIIGNFFRPGPSRYETKKELRQENPPTNCRGGLVGREKV